ncbi:MAG: hypothetical protein K0B15_12240 [Lentimicrobium sp.]|nr:hypothetical protein [Lentimicrobium sp.]
MVTQYPHELVQYIIPESVINPATGDYYTDNTVNQVVNISSCRAEANSEGRKFSNEDGEAYIYQFTVYLPSSVADIAAGTTVQILQKKRWVEGGTVYYVNQTLFSGAVKRFSRGQLNCRLWV